MRDYYRILGVRPDATREEIKDAWNFSVKAFHPDRFAGSSLRQQALAQERTKAINEAYEQEGLATTENTPEKVARVPKKDGAELSYVGR